MITCIHAYLICYQEEVNIKKSKKIAMLLRIQCEQCGSCCCDPVIEVTHHDLRRLVKHLGVPAERLIRLYSPSDFNDDDDSDWITLSYGRRKLGLKKKPDGTCIFLSDKRQCTAYEARPMSCRVFPVDVVLSERNDLVDLDLSDVVRDKFIRCRHTTGKPVPFKAFMGKAQQSRNESVSYWKKIEQWNRLPGKGRKNDFLKFLGVTLPAS